MGRTSYQSRLIIKIRRLFPGCIILKNDSGYCQGIPDLTILYGDKWAVLESKSSKYDKFEPNQEYYLELLNKMSFAARIDPSNEEDVLHELQLAFESGRETRVP
jgi:hypothetical protein